MDGGPALGRLMGQGEAGGKAWESSASEGPFAKSSQGQMHSRQLNNSQCNMKSRGREISFADISVG